MVENVSSSISTSGAGFTYEHRVGAMFLTFLLTRAPPMIFTTSRVTKVSFQTKRLGWETDDLLVECSTKDSGNHKLAIQAKLNFRIQRKLEQSVETFQRFWKDFNAERFNLDEDALMVAAAPGHSSLKWFERLVVCARDSSDAEDFQHRLETKGSISSDVIKIKQAIHSIIEEIDSSGATEEKLWQFLKVIYIWFFDFPPATNQTDGYAKHLLDNSATGSDSLSVAEDTWNALVMFAADSARGERTICRANLPRTILKRHAAVRVAAFEKLSNRSSTVLESISSTIAGGIDLPREEKIAETVEAIEEKRVVILTGRPGSGKSALAKKVVQRCAGSHTCLSFRAEEFAESHIERVLPDSLSGRQFEALLGMQRVLIHVESLERLFEHSTRDAFSDLVRIAERCPNVCLLLTCRDQAVSLAWSAFFERNTLSRSEIKVPPFDDEELQQVTTQFPHLRIPLEQQGLNRLLRIPYLLDMAAKMSWPNRTGMPIDSKAFREKCWHDIIRKDSYAAAGLNDRRESVIVDLSLRRARRLRPFVPAGGLDAQALAELHKDGIVIRDEEGLLAPAHDVIEDWSIIFWIGSLAAKHEWQARPMAEEIGAQPALRRGFREWLREELVVDMDKADLFVLSSYGDRSLSSFFRDDVMVCMLLSDSVRDFLSRKKTCCLTMVQICSFD